MTALDLIKAAFRVIGVSSQGDPLSSEDAQNGLEAMQIMLRRLGTISIVIPYYSDGTGTTVANTKSYTVGPGGDIDTVRPSEIANIIIRDVNGNDYPVDPISLQEYKGIVDKASTGRPYVFFYNPTMPTGTIKFWPTPAQAETIVVSMLQPLSQPDELTDAVTFPPEYDAVIKWNLALELFSEYGLPVRQGVASLASGSITPILSKNAANQMAPVELDLPGGRYPVYNINTDR